MTYTSDEIKARLGAKAAEYVQEGMLVGLGTGSTAAYFISSLIARCQAGLSITVVSSSLRSQEQAIRGGLVHQDFQKVSTVDLTVDGADEIDPQFRLIKGGGGAHLREKIVAVASRKLLIIADESKLVPRLGQGSLPIEIVPFGISSTIRQIENLGYRGKLRSTKEGAIYLTDNQNYLFDIFMPGGFPHPEKTHQELIQIPAVVETGFFFDLADELLIGYQDGHLESKKRGDLWKKS